jgi:hypothetical protein
MDCVRIDIQRPGQLIRRKLRHDNRTAKAIIRPVEEFAWCCKKTVKKGNIPLFVNSGHEKMTCAARHYVLRCTFESGNLHRMKKYLTPLAGLLLLVVFSAPFCVKPPDYPKEPVIEFSGLSKAQLVQGKAKGDSLSISFTYTDGDGDLGFPKTDPTASVFVRDDRDSFSKFEYQLPYVEPQGASNGISGEISIVVPTSCCIYVTPGGAKLACDLVPPDFLFDTLYYYITIRDRAGNLSNEIKAGPITLRCQ